MEPRHRTVEPHEANASLPPTVTCGALRRCCGRNDDAVAVGQLGQL